MTTNEDTMPPPIVAAVPRVALTPEEAAKSLGVSRTFFDDQVLPELAHVRRGRRILVPVKALEKWAESNMGR